MDAIANQQALVRVRAPAAPPPSLGDRRRYVAPTTTLAQHPDAKQDAETLYRWLLANELFLPAPRPAPERLSSHFLQATNDKKLAAQLPRDIEQVLPHRRAHAPFVADLLISRAHAEQADPDAVQARLKYSINKLLQQIDKGYFPIGARRPSLAPHLVLLRSPHYDGCLFNPSVSLRAGGQGVFMVGVTTQGAPVAVKALKPEIAPPGRAVLPPSADKGQLLQREARTMRHAQQLDYLQCIETESYRCLVMPLFSANLSQVAATFLNQRSSQMLPSDAEPRLSGARYLFANLLCGLINMHDARKLLHQDIKPDNILVKRSSRKIVFADFGISAELDGRGEARCRGHTLIYAAPEQLVGHNLSVKSDVFSLAASMCHLLTTDCAAVKSWRSLHFPREKIDALFLGDRDEAVLLRQTHDLWLTSDPLAPRSPAQAKLCARFASIHQSIRHFDPPLAALLQSMLRGNPALRPTAQQAHDRLLSSRAHQALLPADLDRAWAGVPTLQPAMQREIERLTEDLAHLVSPVPSPSATPANLGALYASR